MHLIVPSEETNKMGYSYKSSSELDCCPYLQSVLASFPCDKLIYRVHLLKAGGKINLHQDLGRGLKNGIVRLHIPVTTNEQNYFYIEEERIQLKNQECWFTDITKPHYAENGSKVDRYQLMIDCELNEWWEKLLEE